MDKQPDENINSSLSSLASANRRFYKMFDALLEGVQIINYNWEYKYVNQALADQVFTTKEALLGHTMMDKYPGIDQTPIFDVLKKCMDNRQSSHIENEFVYPDKLKRWFKLNVEPVEEGLMILSLDITAHKEATEKLNRSNRLYAFISQVNQQIVHVKDEVSLFTNACKIATEFGKFRMAWIGMFDESHTKINLVEQSGMPVEYMPLFKDVTFSKGGPIEYVLRSGHHYLCNNIQQDLEMENWLQFASKSSFQSFVVLPIKKAGETIGIFSLYATEINFAEKEEVELLLQIDKDISFALDNIDKARKHQEAEDLVFINEKRFRVLIEKSNDLKTLSDGNGKIFYISPSITTQFGYTIEDAKDTLAFQFVHPDDWEYFLKKRENLLEKPGTIVDFQHRMRHKDGHWIWVEGTITNLLDEPAIHALVANFRDVTEKKASEDQQEFDRNNLHALINNTSDLMWSVDRNFNLITSNKPFDDIIILLSGKPIEKGKNISGEFPREIVERHKKNYERAFKGEVFTVIDYGTEPVEYWAEVSFFPILKGNKVIGTACHTKNITEIKKAEQLLRKSEGFNRGILRSLKAHIAVVDKQGCIVSVNEAWNTFAQENGDASLLHCGEGSNYFDVCNRSAAGGDTLAQKALDGMMEVFEDRRDFFYIEYPCHSPEIERWFAMRVMKFDSDEPMLVVSHQDISERKFAEQKLISKNEELQKTNAELDRFVYSVSHDLRSPLTSILGLLSFIEEESKEEDTLFHSKMIKDGINRLDGSIKNILSYSRNNRTEAAAEKIEVEKMVQDVVQLLANKKDDINFEINIQENNPFYSDRQRLTTIVENLVSNAIKYHKKEEPGRYIKISGHTTNNTLRLTIEDNGIGIAVCHHQKIFDMFYRLPGKAVGSGIGLYIVKETIEKINGAIAVESEEGKGTTFTITLKNLLHD